MRRVMAMVLAGGRGEGLGVLSVPRAAPALPFGGKYRVIDFTADENQGVAHRVSGSFDW